MAQSKDQKNADKAKNQQADEADRNEARALTEDQASPNPVTAATMEGNYDPTGQIVQPGQPLHSTDPQEQAAFETQRQEAIRRSQMGERLGDNDEDLTPADRADEREAAERREGDSSTK